MLPSGLVGVIETLRGRIERHRPALSQSEALTRYALIDPLLRELGWDTADPDLVTPEYSVSGKRADYALLESGKVVVFLEAKRLGENLTAEHRSQVAAYASELGIRYPALTNGNQWEVYDNSQLVYIDQRRILTVSLTGAPPAVNALQLLLLWRPNLASGEPVAAREPIVGPVAVDSGIVEPVSTQPAVITPVEQPVVVSEWIPLTDVPDPTGKPVPSTIRLPGGEERQLSAWNHVIFEVAGYLVRAGKLTVDQCTVRVPGGTRYIVHSEAIHSNGRPFGVAHRLTDGLFCEGDVSGTTLLNSAKSLLQHCGIDAGTVHIKFN